MSKTSLRTIEILLSGLATVFESLKISPISIVDFKIGAIIFVFQCGFISFRQEDKPMIKNMIRVICVFLLLIC